MSSEEEKQEEGEVQEEAEVKESEEKGDEKKGDEKKGDETKEEGEEGKPEGETKEGEAQEGEEGQATPGEGEKVLKETLPSKKEAQKSTSAPSEPEEEPPSMIMERMEEPEIEALHSIFLAAEGKKLDAEEFREALKSVAKIEMSQEDFIVLFMKMDSNRDGFVDWDEFVSHLLLEFQEKEMATMQQELKLPLEGYPRVLRTMHRHPVARVIFCPAVALDRTTNFLHGKYITVSKDGLIHYWSLDFELEGTEHSECPELKVHSTWVTDLVCLPDINIMCTSSTERDLRFYDVAARNFELRVMITSWEFAVICMHYHFHQDINDPSYLITGDTGGNVRILVFSSKGKGPFYHKPGVDLIHIRYEGLARGELPGLKVLEFRNIHTDWVRQVSYYSSLKTFMSCSPCPDRSLYMSDVMGTKMQYKYNVSKGVTCFSVAEESHIIVTGGPDCMVRVWNVFVSSKASCVFQGHHAAIVSIVLQEAGQRIYSLSKDKCIKVWDVAAQACIQTYTGLPPELGERTPLTTLYNPINRNFIVASLRIAIVVLGATVDERTDGFTHTKAVTMALYNKLFKCVVTVGMDSSIMVWDPWNGKRMFLVKDAHIRMSYGEPKPVEITAATFDPSQQLLLTGARDGSLKVWNFNTGTCLRNMNIEQNCEVTCVIWLRNRILAVGWNRHVTEFADKGKITYGKSWDVHHTDDVLCAAYRANQALASSSYKGELVFWQLETGHAYARYNVASPHDRLQLSFKKERSPSVSRPSLSQRTGHKPSFSVKMTESTSSSSIKRKSFEKKPSVDKGIREPKEKKTRRLSVIQLPADGTASGTRSLSVHAMVFLETRPMQANVGSLLLSLETGVIQLWSHHSAGGYLGQYLAVHMSGDYVVSMATDPQNEFLFTGTTMGYMKIWLMKNYGIPEPEHICMPLYRLQFPFLWKDRIEGRAKRCIRDQKWPLLLSSYKGHLLSINHIEYLTACKVLITSSSDTTVRMWTLGGLYLGTLGSYRPWNPLKSDAEPRDFEVRLPPEIKRIASSTTFKVLMGGDVHVGRQKVREEKDEFKELPRHVIKQMVYGERLKKPYLGHFFKLPPRKPAPPIPKLDSSMQYVPVYCHLKIPELEEIKRPQTPEKLAKMMRFKTKPQTRAHTDGAQGGRTSGRHRRGSSKESKKRTGSSRGPSASTEEAGKKRTVSLDVK